MLQASALVVVAMLAAIFVVAFGPIPGIACWLFVLGMFNIGAKRLRRYVWPD